MHKLMMHYCWITIALLLHNGLMVEGIFNKSDEALLSEEIMARMQLNGMYWPLILTRPVSNATHVVDVKVKFLLKQLIAFDEKDQMMTTFYLKKFEWMNPHMSWKKENYGGIDHLRFPKKDVWLPDIILLNAISSHVPTTADVEYVHINYDGHTTLQEPVIYKSPCLVDMWNFPYDVQRCGMRFGSWSYAVELLNMVPDETTMDLSQYIQDQEWKLTDSTVHEEHVGGFGATFEDLVYQFSLERNPSFYFKLILIPTFLLALLVLTVFWIPPSRPDRTNLGMSVFAGFMLLLLLVVNIAPPSTGIKIGTYYCINIILVVTSTVLSGVVVAMSSKEIEMSAKMRDLFVYKLGNFFKVFEQYDHMMRHGQATNSSTGAAYMPTSEGLDMEKIDESLKHRLTGRRDWQVTAVVLDRFFFTIYLLVVIICLGLYFPWPENLDWLTD